jgi:hypothetical protein
MKIDPPLEPSWKDHPTQTPVSKGGGKRPLKEILVVVETQMVLTVEYWRR